MALMAIVGRRLAVLAAVNLAVIAAVVATLIAVTGGGAEPVPAAALRVDRFDAVRAFADVRMQVRAGPRPAGSRALRRVAVRLRDALPNGRFEPVPGHPGLRNVVGGLPGRAPAIVVAAHYDTKDLPGFVGANDGASGTAAVLEIARALRRLPRPAGAPALRFVLFDGEESPDDAADFYRTALRGSKAHAAAYAGETRAVVLLDLVGGRDLRLPREASSDRRLWARLRAAAGRVGAAAAFPDEVRSAVLDDHTPFLRRGVPAIDLIDFEFDCWHERCDDLPAVSAESLDLVGETVVELLRVWR